MTEPLAVDPLAVVDTGCQDWPVIWPCPTDTVDPALVDAAQMLASQLLWAMSGYRIGLCAFREAFTPAASGACGFPYKDENGYWRNNGRLGSTCCRVLLSHRPIASIMTVESEGVALDPAEYVLEGSWLRSRNGCWPVVAVCDDPALIVTYQSGVSFPAGTGAAVGEVACEYLTALQGGQCRLPSRATSITRQGVTVTLEAVQQFTRNGQFMAQRRIGLPVTDAWLESVVGNGPRVASRVYSPDLPRAIRV